jgi:hypothetical protein
MATPTNPIPMFRPEEIDQFWSRIDQSNGPGSCWEWQGDPTCFRETHNLDGYGQMSVCRLKQHLGFLAHRVAYYLGHGQEPGQLHVLHTCDNPSCCNPAHLFLGTPTDNMQDMVAKGRSNAGRSRVQLTEEAIRQIRASRQSNSMLAVTYGVSRCTISKIKNRHTWKHIA